ncbi:hybrid sensor histidine kinase/response regulator [Phenylobacterium sp.]|jgi:PAS domain S-box-containing protein|uniref:hybrid sensor histidine kinase/response regulator n=1 Tax=Phenylobacterium sp. TaxID=1871053 RepID=UPI002F3E5B24
MIGRWAQRFATAIERPLVAYGLVFAAVGVAAALRWGAGLVMPDPPPFMPFFPAVLFATLVAGARGGVAAMALSTVAVAALFVPDAAGRDLWTTQHAQLAMFAVTAMLMVFMAKALRLGILHGVAAEERFRAAQDAALDAFVILEPLRQDGQVTNFRWVYANPAADRTSPAAIHRLRGLKVTEVFPPDGAADMIGRLKEVLEHGGPDDMVVRRTIDGQERWMRSSGVRLRGGVAVTYRDVTAERESEQALRDTEAQLRVLMNALPQLLWSARADGWCDYFSPQWTAFAGGEPGGRLGRGWLSAVHPEDRDDVERAWEQAVAGLLPFDIEYRLRRHDGVWRWFAGRATSVRGENGAVGRWYGAATDISEIIESRRDLEERVAERTRELEASLEERARAEATLAQAQRLETVGRLTGGVAHDFNNLLTVVIGGLDMILRAPDDPVRVKRLGEAALAAGRRGERLTRQLLAFSRRQELKLEVIDVAGLVLQAEPLVRRAAGEALDLVLHCAPGLAASRVDAAQFESALLNLVVNASDATPAGGWIRIEASPVRLAEGEVAGAAAGDYVRVSVADNGAGMAPEVLGRVFEPFFTTKEVGKGTGLGLAQVYGFVSQSDGAVAIDSAVGRGTTISLYLPAVTETPAQPQAAAPAPEDDWRRGARVLLVEDDAAVRAVTECLLEELDCQVACEPDGVSALRRLERDEAFDLVISDVVMPGGMTGIDLARAAAAVRPGLPFVLTTGYAGGQAGELDWPVLRKPFRAEQLAAVLRQTLGRTPERAD